MSHELSNVSCASPTSRDEWESKSQLFKEIKQMKLTSQSFQHNGRIPQQFAFCKPDPETHATFSDNQSPELSWSDVPDGCRSFTLICVDPDAPSVGDDVNQPGRTVSVDLARANFHHWVMVDIPVQCSGLGAGECSSEVTPGGKQSPSGPGRQGVNDYTSWFAGDDSMGGDYLGYDGPAPPWNDETSSRRSRAMCWPRPRSSAATRSTRIVCPVDLLSMALRLGSAVELSMVLEERHRPDCCSDTDLIPVVPSLR